MRWAAGRGFYWDTYANSYCGRTSSDLASLGHLKVNCPEGAREATLGCPQRGRLFRLAAAERRGRRSLRFTFFFVGAIHESPVDFRRKSIAGRRKIRKTMFSANGTARRPSPTSPICDPGDYPTWSVGSDSTLQWISKEFSNSIRRADHSDQSREPKGCYSTARVSERFSALRRRNAGDGVPYGV